MGGHLESSVDLLDNGFSRVSRLVQKTKGLKLALSFTTVVCLRPQVEGLSVDWVRPMARRSTPLLPAPPNYSNSRRSPLARPRETFNPRRQEIAIFSTSSIASVPGGTKKKNITIKGTNLEVDRTCFFDNTSPPVIVAVDRQPSPPSQWIRPSVRLPGFRAMQDNTLFHPALAAIQVVYELDVFQGGIKSPSYDPRPRRTKEIIGIVTRACWLIGWVGWYA